MYLILEVILTPRQIKLEDVAYPSADEGIQTPDHFKGKQRNATIAKSSRFEDMGEISQCEHGCICLITLKHHLNIVAILQ